MKNCFTKSVVIAAALMLSTSLAFAADVKVNPADATGAAKGAAAKTKAGAKAAVADTKASAVATKDAAKGTAKGAVADTKNAAKSKIVDINTATDAELKAIPGIGDSYAAKIIAGRPYANKGQLKTRNVLPGPVYEKVKDQLVAKQVKK